MSLSIPEIEESFFYVHSKAEIDWIKNVCTVNGTLSYRFTRNLAISLYGATIRLGKCHIYCGGAKPKSSVEINRKINTWEEGDIRQITTDFKDGEDIFIFPEEYVQEKQVILPSGVYIVEMPDDAQLLFNDFMKSRIKEY